jgi:hypothetical protein
MSSVFRQNEYFKRFAVLIPMLRVRQVGLPLLTSLYCSQNTS